MPTKSALKQLTVSIVSYNTKALLQRCLQSIFKFTKKLSFEVIVVDNASTDGSAKMVEKYFPRVKLIKNKKNRFYSGANNQALSLSRGKYFLILNSDIFLKDNALKKMVDYLDRHSRVGAIEPLQLYENGRAVVTGTKHNRLELDLCQLTLLHKIIRHKKLPHFRMEKMNRAKTWPAEVICDAALMTRTKLIRSFGGYDEKMKLYYTENDLCRQLQLLNYQTVHHGSARVWHRVSASTQKAGWKKISPIFSVDARAYYSKYQSKLAGWTLFMAMKLSNLLVELKQSFWLISLILFATWLRFYRLPETMMFIGDQGRDYLAARDMLLTGHWPLVGIPSSIPWLRQGPFFIWLTSLALKWGGSHPVAPAVMTAVLGVLTVYLVYRYSRSLLSGLMLATSPLVILHNRMPYHISPIPLFTILYLLAVKNLAAGWSFFLAGVLLQFELTTLPLVFLALIYLYRKKIKIFPPLLTLLIPFIPKFIYDLNHGFTQTAGFAAWTVHRLGEWRPWESFVNVSKTSWFFWQRFSSWNSPWLAAGLLIIGLTVLSKNRLLKYFLIINLLAFYIHGAPSEAYFPVLFPVWAMMLGLIRNKLLRFTIIGMCLFNAYFAVNHNFLTYGPNLSQRLQLTSLIKKQSQGQPVKLINPSSIPFTSHLDNYRFLLWWQGIEVNDQAALVYQIDDLNEINFIAPRGTTVFHLDKQKLIKL